VLADGPSNEVIESYISATSNNDPAIGARHGLSIHSVTLRNGAGEAAHHFYPCEDLTIEIEYTAGQRLDRPYIWISIDSERGPCFSANMYLDGSNVAVLEGPGKLACTFKSLPLIPQAYRVRMAMRQNDSTEAIIEPQQVANFSVIGDLEDYGLSGVMAHVMAPTTVPVIVPYEWTLPDGQKIAVSLRESL
jgi:hypothetical protein